LERDVKEKKLPRNCWTVKEARKLNRRKARGSRGKGRGPRGELRKTNFKRNKPGLKTGGIVMVVGHIQEKTGARKKSPGKKGSVSDNSPVPTGMSPKKAD